MSSIKWTGKRTDYTAQVGGYTLRAEMIDIGCWWWACYLPNRGIGGNGHERSGLDARFQAIKAMNEHKQNQ
jgi:hypothetical protein